jgi:hypothetical protein
MTTRKAEAEARTTARATTGRGKVRSFVPLDIRQD